MFTPEIYRRRRSRLLDRDLRGILFFPGNEAVPMNYRDNHYPFRQDSSFLYFWGLNRPDLVACLDSENGSAILFGNDLSPEDQVWTGPQTPLKKVAAKAGVSDVRSLDTLPDFLKQAAGQGRPVVTLPQYRAENMAFIRWLRRETGMGATGEDRARFIQTVISLRSRKAPEEVEEIRRALEITAAFHRDVMRRTQPGMTEQALSGQIEGYALSRGSRMAYPVIFTTRGEILHNKAGAHILQTGELILNDSGADSPGGYASDITRVFPVDNTFSAQQKAIVELVLKMQSVAFQQIRPGVAYREIHLEACRVAAEGLVGLGLMNGDPAEIVAHGAQALFFPHGLGHLLGLDVHDLESLGEDRAGYGPGQKRSAMFGLAALRLARPLQAGFVLTVEPGLYFIPSLIRQWEAEGKFRSFIRYDRLAAYDRFGGVRIEDNVLVTEKGMENLSAHIPKTVSEVEALRK